MSTPEADAYDVAEQGGTGTAAAHPRVPAEADAYDAVEQSADLAPGDGPATTELPLEADPYDAAEQSAVVELDEDEGR